MFRTDPLLMAVLPTAAGPDVELHLYAGDIGQTFPVPPASNKSVIRFAVGEPSRRSTIWRLWAPPNKDDVYLASRRSGDVFKVSLHESGDYRVQLVDRSRTDAVFTDRDLQGSRIIDQWPRPTPSQAGLTEALGLWVPTADVVDVPGDSEKYMDVRWLPAAPVGGVVQFRILLVQPAEAA